MFLGVGCYVYDEIFELVVYGKVEEVIGVLSLIGKIYLFNLKMLMCWFCLVLVYVIEGVV